MAISVAKGTKLTVGGKAVAHLTKIGSPSIKWDTVESTALDTTDDFKQFLNTFAEGGEVSISGNFDFADCRHGRGHGRAGVRHCVPGHDRCQVEL